MNSIVAGRKYFLRFFFSFSYFFYISEKMNNYENEV